MTSAQCAHGRGEVSALVSLFIRAPIPLCGPCLMTSSSSNYLPKAQLPIPSHREGKLQRINGGGGGGGGEKTHIQVITASQVIPVCCQKKMTLVGTTNQLLNCFVVLFLTLLWPLKTCSTKICQRKVLHKYLLNK